MRFDPFAPAVTRALAALLLAAVLFGFVQTVRIDGLRVWPLSIDGLERRLAAMTGARDAEAAAHRATNEGYRNAQATAAARDAQRIARVKAEQKEISDEEVADYERRLADARAAAERLRRELAARAGASGAAGGVVLPGAGAAAGGAAAPAAGDRLPGAAGEAAGDEIGWRLIATEQAIQLDALIRWNRRQAAVGTERGE